MLNGNRKTPQMKSFRSRFWVVNIGCGLLHFRIGIKFSWLGSEMLLFKYNLFSVFSSISDGPFKSKKSQSRITWHISLIQSCASGLNLCSRLKRLDKLPVSLNIRVFCPNERNVILRGCSIHFSTLCRIWLHKNVTFVLHDANRKGYSKINFHRR